MSEKERMSKRKCECESTGRTRGGGSVKVLQKGY